MSRTIIVTGDPLKGFRFTGPFATPSEAEEYAKKDKHLRYADVHFAPVEEPAGDQVPKVLVTVEGGIAEVMGTKGEVDVQIFDWDNYKSVSATDQRSMHLHPSWKELDPTIPTF